jgi:hypothetical protein
MDDAPEKHRAQIGTLVVATSGVQLANGFFGTFIALRVVAGGFDISIAGMVLRVVYISRKASSWLAPRRTKGAIEASVPMPVTTLNAGPRPDAV